MSEFLDELDEAVAAAMETEHGHIETHSLRLARSRDRGLELLDWTAALFSDVALRHSHGFEFVDKRAPAEEPRSLVLAWRASSPQRTLTVNVFEEDGTVEWSFDRDGQGGERRRLEALTVTTRQLERLVLRLVRGEIGHEESS